MESARPPAVGPNGRILAKIFIAGWLAAQLAYPFVTRFDLHPFRYRWAPAGRGVSSRARRPPSGAWRRCGRWRSCSAASRGANRDGATYVGNVYWYYLDEGRAVEQEIRVQAPR